MLPTITPNIAELVAVMLLLSFFSGRHFYRHFFFKQISALDLSVAAIPTCFLYLIFPYLM